MPMSFWEPQEMLDQEFNNEVLALNTIMENTVGEALPESTTSFF